MDIIYWSVHLFSRGRTGGRYLASCKFLLIKVHYNLLKDPSNNKSICLDSGLNVDWHHLERKCYTDGFREGRSTGKYLYFLSREGGDNRVKTMCTGC